MSNEPTVICCGCFDDYPVSECEVLPAGHLHAGEPICVSCADPLAVPVPPPFEMYEGANLDD